MCQSRKENQCKKIKLKKPENLEEMFTWRVISQDGGQQSNYEFQVVIEKCLTFPRENISPAGLPSSGGGVMDFNNFLTPVSPLSPRI